MSFPRHAVVLAGGTGSRLFPTTRAVNKHLLPVYDQPLLLLVLEQLVRWGSRSVTLVVTPEDRQRFERLLDGVRPARFECIDYLEQAHPGGVAEPLRLMDASRAGERFLYVLGDNIIGGAGVDAAVAALAERPSGAGVLGMAAADMRRFGVARLDAEGKVLSLEEKPRRPDGGLALPGLYFLDRYAFEFAAGLSASGRGELEITDILKEYLRANALHLQTVDGDQVWFDIATPEDLFRASSWRRDQVLEA